MIGKTISHYQILEKLGEGGMGVVYKARDTHLDRFVAIKVLPAEKVTDQDRKRRFVQEAKAASSLNHPNIVTVYDIDQAEGIDFIAMEYVSGKTLGQLIPRKGLRLDEALRYSIQMADALAMAHAAGIVHRDLKPSNVMVTVKGLVKVLDFGLAKLTEPIESDEFKTTEALDPITEQGAIVGTVAYMSPEQAEGKKVDERSDIFSLGSLLYEIVTGQMAFQGTSKVSILSAILHQEPKPVSTITQGIPADLQKLISRCLRKDPERRIHHMDDVKLALLELKEDSDSGALKTVAVAKQRPRHRLIWAFGAAAALLIVAVGVWLVRSKGGVPEVPLVAVPLSSYPGEEDSPSFSPDGSQVAFSWDGEKQDNFDIYVKQIDVEPPFRLTHDPAPDFSPAWSPDGRIIACGRYFSPTRIDLILVPQRGGPERVLAEIDLSGKEQPLDGPFLAWTPDSKGLVFPVPEAGQRARALYLFSVETGERRRLTNPPTDIAGDTAPSFAPDGRTLAFARESLDSYNCDLYLLHLGEGYSVLGDPERIALDSPFSIDAVWMPNGREILFVSGTRTTVGLWRMMASKPAMRKRLTFAKAFAPAVSQQGNRLAYVARRDDTNIWRIDLNEPERGPSVPIPFISSTQAEWMPAYSPDGKRIAFISQRSGTDEIWVCNSNGSKAVQLTSFGGESVYGPRWSWDNQYIAFTLVKKGMKDDVYVVNANGGVARRLSTHPAEDRWPYWSRNGKWIYFASTRSGQDEIWKMPAGGGEAVQITRNFGDVPQESPDGKLIYYMKGWPGVLSVWRTPAEGGEETKVLDSVHAYGAWAIANDGIYFFRKPDEKGHSDICLYDFTTGKSRKLVTIERAVTTGIALSPTSKTILYPQVDEASSDLMLVENFR